MVRSSHQMCSMKKGVFRNFAKFRGKRQCQSLFFTKVAGLRHKYFPMNFAKFLKPSFSQNTPDRLLLNGFKRSRKLYFDTFFPFIINYNCLKLTCVWAKKVLRGGSRAAAKSKMECIVIIVNG